MLASPSLCRLCQTRVVKPMCLVKGDCLGSHVWHRPHNEGLASTADQLVNLACPCLPRQRRCQQSQALTAASGTAPDHDTQAAHQSRLTFSKNVSRTALLACDNNGYHYQSLQTRCLVLEWLPVAAGLGTQWTHTLPLCSKFGAGWCRHSSTCRH